MENTIKLEILKNNLFKQCEEGKTGTVYVSTINNKSCHVVITDGQIVASKMGRIKGLEAVYEMNKNDIKGATFSEGMQLDYSDESKILSSDAVLKLLGYIEPKANALIDVEDSENKLDYSNIFDFLNGPEDINEV